MAYCEVPTGKKFLNDCESRHFTWRLYLSTCLQAREVAKRLKRRGTKFYQLPSFTDEVDLNQKLAEWEGFYNYCRPHTSQKGKTPYEALREKLQS